MSKPQRLEPTDNQSTSGLNTADRTAPFWIAVAIMMVIVFLVHLNGLRTPHIEGDEAVFTFLAERLRESPGAYHLRGELHGEAAQAFLRDVWQPRFQVNFDRIQSISLMHSPPDGQGRQHPVYDPAIYGRPMFFHPPVYPCLLAVSRGLLGSDGGPLLSTAIHCITVLLTALLGRLLLDERIGMVAAALVALESVSWMCGERLWIDGALQAAVTGATLAAVWSAERGHAWRFSLAGAALGIAGLTKLPAGALAPAIALWWCCCPRRPRWGEMAAYAITAAALVLPWIILMKVQVGSFLPSERPSDWLLDMYPRIRRTLERPATYYLVGLLAASPVLGYCVVGWWKCRREPWLWMVTAWALSISLAVTVIGATGMGYQLRYLAPIMPALCLIAAAGIARVRWWWRIPVLALAAYTWHTGVQNALLPGTVDPAPLALSKYLDGVFGWNIAEWFPRMW
jgi:4-amino-4-deoxy-L-arabinose transferase-like glycosyltransferase